MDRYAVRTWLSSAIVLFILVLTPVIVAGNDIAQCYFTFHEVDQQHQINPSPYLTSEDIVIAEMRKHRPTNEEVVYIKFNERGAAVNKEFTETHIGRYIAVYCGDALLSKPRILAVSEAEVIISIK